MSSGTKLVSSGSDGLVRVWNSQDGSAVATLDEEQHSAGGKIWALDAARDGELLISGGWKIFVLFVLLFGFFLTCVERL